jgi:hypothetical protein
MFKLELLLEMSVATEDLGQFTSDGLAAGLQKAVQGWGVQASGTRPISRSSAAPPRGGHVFHRFAVQVFGAAA